VAGKNEMPPNLVQQLFQIQGIEIQLGLVLAYSFLMVLFDVITFLFLYFFKV
jgi:hypothetical protein